MDTRYRRFRKLYNQVNIRTRIGKKELYELIHELWDKNNKDDLDAVSQHNDYQLMGLYFSKQHPYVKKHTKNRRITP